MAPDAELVRRIARGEGKGAEEELCRRFAPRVRLYGLRHLRDEDRARDLVQSVLLAVLEAARAGRIEEPEHLDRFVLGVSRNHALRAREVAARAALVEPSELDVAGAVPDMASLDFTAMFRCLGGLDLRARTVLQLSFYAEKSADEIADALTTTAGNVRVVRHRAMRQLRDCIEGGAGGAP